MNRVQKAIFEFAQALQTEGIALGVAITLDRTAFGVVREGYYNPVLGPLESDSCTYCGIPITFKDMRPRREVTVNGVQYREILENDPE